MNCPSNMSTNYWDVMDRVYGRKVLHANFQVKLLQSSSSRKAVYQNKDWTCSPFTPYCHLHATIVVIIHFKSIEFEWPHWRQRTVDNK
jgi:hypothetical protein